MVWASSLSVLLPFLAGLVGFKCNDKDLRWLVPFFAFATAVEITSLVLSRHYANNIWLINIYLVIECAVFVNLLAYWHGRAGVRYAALLASIAYASFWAWSVLHRHSLYEVNNPAFTAAAMLNVAFSGLALYELSGLAGPSLLRNPRFWFAAGILILYSVDVTIFSIYDLVTQRGGEMLRSMFAIHFVFNIFANTLYAVGFLCTSQPLKSR